MSVVDKIRSMNGILNYLSRFDIPNFNPNREFRMNKFFITFFKFNNIKGYRGHNSKNYKGNFRPSIENADLISCEYWKEFCDWCNLHFEKRSDVV